MGATLLAASAAKAQEMKVDGGLAAIQDKVVPDRQTHLVPPGALGARNFAKHCTACQLCVSACPNDVLKPSTNLTRLMQPEMNYEHGYCRPECTKCSEVCPTGAIRPITREDKSSTQIGHAVWVKKNCIPLTDGVLCTTLPRRCHSDGALGCREQTLAPHTGNQCRALYRMWCLRKPMPRTPLQRHLRGGTRAT